MKKLTLSLAMLATLLGGIAAQAACPCSHTYVSKQNGSASDCDFGTPCNSIATAVANTSQRGILSIIDGDFSEAITINQSITILANEQVVLRGPDNSTAITINAASNDDITINHLFITGRAGGGGTGITFNTGSSFFLVDSVVNLFDGIGLNFVPNTAANAGQPTQLHVLGSKIIENENGNVLLKPSNSVVVSAIFDHAAIKQAATYGIRADNSGGSGSPLKVDVIDSVVSYHGNNGFLAVGTGPNPIYFMIDRSTANTNLAYGAVATGSQAFMTVTNSTIMGNTTGLAQLNGATVATLTNNTINFNTTNTSGTITPIAPK